MKRLADIKHAKIAAAYKPSWEEKRDNIIKKRHEMEEWKLKTAIFQTIRVQVLRDLRRDKRDKIISEKNMRKRMKMLISYTVMKKYFEKAYYNYQLLSAIESDKRKIRFVVETVQREFFHSFLPKLGLNKNVREQKKAQHALTLVVMTE